MGDLYDPVKESTFIQYLDVNNLYGCAMSQPLPTGDFEWVNVNPSEIDKLVASINKGYILEVDIRYLRELHDSHNELLFMCERMKITVCKR